MTQVRLNKFISECTGISRRKVDTLISEGKITVNRKPAQIGQQIDPDQDVVVCDGKKLARPKKLYVMLNKPKGYITTRTDPEKRKTVYDLLPEKYQHLDPVGRLDRNSTGLLLFSNDGDFIQRLIHPRYKHKKVYKVKVDHPLDQSTLFKLEKGIRLQPEDQVAEFYVREIVDQHTVVLETATGLNRQIRRSFELLGYEVKSLKRTAMGQIQLGQLAPGQVRTLKPSEVRPYLPKPTPHQSVQRKGKKRQPGKSLSK